jgi:hypothetical protein
VTAKRATPGRGAARPEFGALLELTRRLALGEVSAARAVQIASSKEITASLVADQIDTQSSLASSEGDRGRWKTAIQALRLAWAALDASGTRLDDRRRFELVRQWVGLTALALNHAADPRLYDDARVRGERAFEDARAAGDRTAMARLAFALGALHLDPYTLHRALRPDNIADARNTWRERLAAGETWDGESVALEPGDVAGAQAFPDAPTALSVAADWLRRAHALDVDSERERILKAFLQTLMAQRTLGVPDLEAEITSVGVEALAFYDAAGDPARVIEVAGHLALAAVPVDGAVVERALAPSLDDILRRYQVGDAFAWAYNGAGVLRDLGRPRDALRLLATSRPLLDLVDATQRADWYRRERVLLAQAFAGSLDPASALGVAVQLGEASAARNEEHIALGVLERARVTAPLTAAVHRDALDHLRAMLSQGVGINAWSAGNQREAPQWFLTALGDAISVRDPRLTSDLVGQLTASISEGRPEELRLLNGAVAQHYGELISLLGDNVDETLSSLFAAAVVCAAFVHEDSGLLDSTLAIAKGFRFGLALLTGAGRRYHDTPLIRATRERAAEVLADHRGADLDASTIVSRLREQLLVSPLRPRDVALAGGGAGERVANLRAQADTRLEAEIARSAHAAMTASVPRAFRRPPEAPDVVILELFITTLNDVPVIVRVLRSEGQTFADGTRLAPAARAAPMVVDGLRTAIDDLGARVWSLRRALLDDPPAGSAATDAATASLQALGEIVLGSVGDGLRLLHAQGKRHLCIVPHGALHVAPLHLLSYQGRLLADDWLVTYLPTTWALARPVDPDPQRARDRGLTAIGVSFQSDPRGLAPLGNVHKEVGAVAAACNGDAVLDEGATKAAVVDALERSRFVHIATHGAHDPAAGSYHTLYLTQDANDDGRLYAYELLGKDLRGLELVTLSACETAVARYDPLGNPRGIPAALFLAGARALVGTLWDIETNAAETFFRRLYERIGSGSQPRDAFLDAQRTTRAQHPELRDWGAFYFTGDWR